MISIIIPAYNEEKLIEQTVSNLKSKITLPHEIIVVDGGSKDNTIAAARRVADLVVAYPDPAHQNISKNRNFGAAQAQYDILLFMEADSVVKDGTIFGKALEHFKKDQNLVALNTKLRIQEEVETVVDYWMYKILNLSFYFTNNVFKSGWSTGKFQMVRKDAFNKIGGYREDLVTAEDGDVFIRLGKIGRIFMDTSLTVFYSGRRIHKIGWIKMLWIWSVDSVSYRFRNKPVSKVWTDIR